MTAADRVDEPHTRRAARAADRAAFEERRLYGLNTRHAAKLARLTAKSRQGERNGADAALSSS